MFVATPAYVDVLRRKHLRLYSTQIVEEAMEVGRREEDRGSNKRSSLSRQFTALIQSKLVDTRHKYKQSFTVEQSLRHAGDLPFHLYKPSLTDFVERNPACKQVVGASASPTWYSPNCANSCHPMLDLDLYEYAKFHGKLDCVANVWLTGLVKCCRVLVKCTLPSVNGISEYADEWCFCLGDMAAHSILLWPAKASAIGLPGVRPDPDVKVAPLSIRKHIGFILDVRNWRAKEYTWQSPVSQFVDGMPLKD